MGWDMETMMIWLMSLQSHQRELCSKVSRFHLTWANNHNSLCKITWKDSQWWFAQIRCREWLNPTWVGSWMGTHLWLTIATTTWQHPQDWCHTTCLWLQAINYQIIKIIILIISMSEPKTVCMDEYMR